MKPATINKRVLYLLVVLNVLVLLGQLWPEGAPPFASLVNGLTIAGNIAFFLDLIRKKEAGTS